MTWFIVFFMSVADPFAVKTLEFNTRNECVEYVNDPSNSDRLAIEVIDAAGFNDEIFVVACLPEYDIPTDREEQI